MKKILFLIHDLGQGGAEKVLVNLVNNMDRSKFDITVMALFGGGVNEQFLRPEVRLIHAFKHPIPGNSRLMKLLSPRLLHRWLIREKYDIEVSYLEGPCARIISGCPNPETKLICWIHSSIIKSKQLAASFRNLAEASACYCQFDKIVCVSQNVQEHFCRRISLEGKTCVLYNTVESDEILKCAAEGAPEIADDGAFKLVSAGTLKEVKGFDRLLRIVKRLKDDGKNVHLYLLGKGPLESQLRSYITENGLENAVTMLGYQTNPYRYVAKCDLFVCSSHSEGFSTAVTEALIVGTPVCTVDVSGMKELLGEHNEFGIVTENTEKALYEGIRMLLDDPQRMSHYKSRAQERGRIFSTQKTVLAAEDMFMKI